MGNAHTRHNNSREMIQVLPKLNPVHFVDVLQSLLLIDRNESTAAAERTLARESGARLLVLLETCAHH